MPEHDRRNTPGGILAASAFNYAVTFFDFAKTKYPDLERIPAETRYAGLQAAIVVATLIQQERRDANGAQALREGVSRGFPPSARRRCLSAVQDLASYMLKLEDGAFGPDEIPSLAKLAGAGDDQLKTTMSLWLGGTVMDKWTLGEADKPAAAAMSRSAWTSAVMIGRALQRGK